MDTSYLYTKTTEQLKLLARQAGIKLPSGANKAKIIALLSEEKQKSEEESTQKAAAPASKNRDGETPRVKKVGRPKKEKPAVSEQPGVPEAKQKLETAEKKAAGTAIKNKPAAKAQNAEKAAANPAPKKRGRPAGSKNRAKQAETDQIKLELTPQLPAESGTDKTTLLSSEAEKPEPVKAEPAVDSSDEVLYERELPIRTETGETEQETVPEELPPQNEEAATVSGAPSGDWGEGQGVLEILPDGYGFLRAENCLPGPKDVYLSQTQIRRFNLRNGDYITGKTRPQRDGDRYEGMIYVSTVNGASADAARRRPRFEDLTPIFPDSRLRLENPLGNTDLALRTIDLIAPIGKGQRGLIVSPPKAGKTVLLKHIANAITDNYPSIQLMVLLIDERPEEVTDMQRSTHGEVFYSTFDEAPENHTRLSEMVLDRAQRQVEMGRDVVILLDSITRLARAYNLVIPPTGRSLSGGLDPGALLKPKKFFGAARNIEFGGSLTIIATALVDTGSRLDDIIYEEFKGTGNMELHLDRKLSERRVFPAIDINRSGTRRDDLLYTPQEAEGALQIRRALAGGTTQDATEQLMLLMEKTPNNEQLTLRIKGWLAALGK